MVTDDLRRIFLAFLEQEIHHPFQGIDQQLILIDRLLLHHGFADVEDMAGVHAVNAVQLDVLRRNLEDGLHRLFGVDHFRHQLEQGGIGAGFIHEEGAD